MLTVCDSACLDLGFYSLLLLFLGPPSQSLEVLPLTLMTVKSRTSSIIESIYYVARDEVESENVIFNLTNVCGKRLYKVTRQNIGKSLSIYYKGNLLSSTMTASALNNNFSLSSKEMPRVILMQLLNNYGLSMVSEKPGGAQ